MEKQKIYLAEDSEPLIVFLQTFFDKKPDYNTTFFKDGLEIYKSIVLSPPALLILDIILPSLSGLAIARLLKYNEHYKHIPIIINSSITDPNIEKNALKAGADIFLAKPFNMEKLFKNISRLLLGGSN